MREIKFRAKALTGELVYFELHESQMSGDCDVFYVRGIPCAVGSEQEYTGLKDKNGKGIYEGDIVRCGLSYTYLPYKEESFTVEYSRFPHRKIAGFYPFYGTLNGYEITPVEVIGNIYENKELLGASVK